MSVITEHGLREAAQRDYRIELAKTRLLTLVDAEGGLTPGLAARSLPGDPYDTREAFWQLLDQGVLRLTVDRLLERNPIPRVGGSDG